MDAAELVRRLGAYASKARFHSIQVDSITLVSSFFFLFSLQVGPVPPCRTGHYTTEDGQAEDVQKARFYISRPLDVAWRN